MVVPGFCNPGQCPRPESHSYNSILGAIVFHMPPWPMADLVTIEVIEGGDRGDKVSPTAMDTCHVDVTYNPSASRILGPGQSHLPITLWCMSWVPLSPIQGGAPSTTSCARQVSMNGWGAPQQQVQYTTSGMLFRFIPPWSVTRVGPATGPTYGGTDITISGDNFFMQASTPTVTDAGPNAVTNAGPFLAAPYAWDSPQ